MRSNAPPDNPKARLLKTGHSKGSTLRPNYRRLQLPGRSYFFTHITYQRYPWLCTDLGRQALRDAIITVRQKHSYECPDKN
jgi:hypothetical protein